MKEPKYLSSIRNICKNKIVKLAHVVTSIKRSPFSCSVIENF